MEPRLKTSKQWTPFPDELCQQCAEVLTERFENEYDLEKSFFVVEGRIYAGEILARFGLKVEGRLKQYNFELSLEYDQEKVQALEVIQSSLDVVEHLWTELLEEDLDDQDLSKNWQSLSFEKLNYHYRYSTVNSHLEQEADKLLEEYEKKLVYGEADLEDEPDQEAQTTLH